MTVAEYLQENHCHYDVVKHKPAYTAEQLATTEHVLLRNVAKCVVVVADGKDYLCVLPADRKVDIYALEKHLKAKDVRLATEIEMKGLFQDCEIGAEPPFGNLYHLPTLMDKTLEKDREVIFQAGSHNESIHMTMKQYKKLVEPTVFKFSYPAVYDELESMPFDPFYYDPFM